MEATEPQPEKPKRRADEPRYLPSPEAIAAATAEIRRGWAADEEQRRKGVVEE